MMFGSQCSRWCASEMKKYLMWLDRTLTKTTNRLSVLWVMNMWLCCRYSLSCSIALKSMTNGAKFCQGETNDYLSLPCFFVLIGTDIVESQQKMTEQSLLFELDNILFKQLPEPTPCKNTVDKLKKRKQPTNMKNSSKLFLGVFFLLELFLIWQSNVSIWNCCIKGKIRWYSAKFSLLGKQGWLYTTTWLCTWSGAELPWCDLECILNDLPLEPLCQLGIIRLQPHF